MSLVARLIEAGTPADLIEEVALLVAAARLLDERRTADRARQHAHREKTAPSRGITLGHVSSRDVTDKKEAPQTPEEKTTPLNGSPKGEPIPPPALLPEHVLEAWNDMAGRLGLSKAKLTPDRRRKLNARIRQHGVEDWTEAISAVERSSFLRGENDRGWRADFDFLLQPASFNKLIEGSYDRSTH